MLKRNLRGGPVWTVAVLGAAAVVATGCGSSSSDSGDSKTSEVKTKSGGALPAANIDWPKPQPAVPEEKGGSKTPIKIGVLSECQGAFGTFDNQNMAGVVSAISQFAGGRPKNPKKPRDGWVGGAIGGHPLKLVGVGCGDDTRGHRDQGDPHAHGAAGRRRHDRAAVR